MTTSQCNVRYMSRNYMNTKIISASTSLISMYSRLTELSEVIAKVLVFKMKKKQRRVLPSLVLSVDRGASSFHLSLAPTASLSFLLL